MLASRIKELREKTGLKQKEFAEKLGLKSTTYNGYETGSHEPKSDFLKLLAKEFNVTVDYILGLSDSPNSHFKGEVDCKSDSLEVTAAYENTDFETKNNVRFLLKLPLLKEEIAEELFPSTKPTLTAKDEKELEMIKQEMLAEKKGKMSSAFTSAKDA